MSISSYSSTSVLDEVSGYTLHYIENYALPYSADMTTLKSLLDDILPGSVTTSQLYTLLNQY